MEYLAVKDPHFEVIAPVVEKSGYRIVELTSRVAARRLHVILRVFSPRGVSLDDCANLHRLIRPLLEISEGKRDVNLEVSSPGLGRKMKWADELQVFRGRGVRYFLQDGEEWISGVLGEDGDGRVEILVGDERRKIPIRSIRKIQLNDGILQP